MQTNRKILTSFACIAASIGVAALRSDHLTAQGSAAQSAPARPLREFVDTYCVTCHNERLKTGGLALDTLDAEQVSNSPETWEKVVVKLRSRSMPPAGSRRPDTAVYGRVATWLETELDRVAAAHVNPGRPAPLHRLNRTEYANAVRDLTGIEVDAPSMLPPDQQAHGFDTNADALLMAPALLDRYLTAAARIARLAVGDPTMLPAFERYTAVKGNSNEQTWLWQTERLSDDFPLGSRGGIAVRHYFPVDGQYILRVRLQRSFQDVIRGLNEPSQIEIRVDGARAAQFLIGGGAELAAQAAADYRDVKAGPLTNADDALQVRIPLTAGLRTVTATILKSNDILPEGLGPARIPIWSREGDVPTVPAAISSLLIGGPYDGRVPKHSPSRSRIFICQPASKAEEISCATKILSTFARRAYRRPATSEDVQVLLGFYRRARAAANFDAGIRAALERVLVSPDFLYRIEADPVNVAPNAVYRLSDVELASRLSFFLWNSIPDDQLLDLAIAGKLRNAGVLDGQVRRMLADPRARTSLVTNFFEQWLEIRNVWLLTPDANQHFPWFDDNLRIAFVKEMDLFFAAQLKEDRSIVDLLTANRTFLNEQLARHYGIAGVYGSHFREVTLTDENRWGLLGKAAVLAVTSYTTRTSPTIRGKWLLENILGAPVPPPPPNIPALEASNTGDTPLSVRDMLERHRKNPTCASCHARMDPLGFGLENFDGIGQWRTRDAGVAIDASGVLLDGTRVEGPAALRQALVSQKEQFVRTVTAKLATYALGREIESFDAPAIRGIVRAAAADDYRWSSTILAIVKSAPFQMRKAGS
jgi:mono/diheme cytochrome c family protein